MQYEQTQLHPWEICSQAWNSRARFIGRCPAKPSNSKNPCAPIESVVRNSARRPICPGPKATSTNGKRSKTSSFTDCAQQPPTPTIRLGSSDLSRFAWPRCAMKRESADSRIEQVLKRIRSAPSRSGASVVAERLEHAAHALRVVLVHLAPEGGYVVARHPRAG